MGVALGVDGLEGVAGSGRLGEERGELRGAVSGQAGVPAGPGAYRAQAVRPDGGPDATVAGGEDEARVGEELALGSGELGQGDAVAPPVTAAAMIMVEASIRSPAPVNSPPSIRSAPLMWRPSSLQALRTPRSARKRSISVTSGSMLGLVLRHSPRDPGGQEHRGGGRAKGRPVGGGDVDREGPQPARARTGAARTAKVRAFAPRSGE
ncbi:hypothetical protein AB0F11_27800 [Streptomyces sp. NPDC032472]|uniref:hypothetical protein n=1 Tax=Streptomyces sp. NPDC032472 TaxID=3155018 RepID=UPI0034045F09